MSNPADPELAALLHDARLDDARGLLAGRVRADPSNARARLDLAELLIVLGEWDKADTHADLASTHDPRRGAAVALTRQLIRAAAWRETTFAERRPPDLVTEPDTTVAAALARLAGLVPAEQDDADASGTLNEAPITGVRDLDDRFGAVLEVLSGDGRYLWIPFRAIVALRPATPRTLRDLIWRPAEIEVRGGPAGTVFLPVIYPGEATPMQRLGRETEWIESDDAVIGRGQRCLLIGDEVVTFDQIEALAVDA